MFELPEPLPSSDNPFQRISWMLFIAYVAGRELTRLRRDQVQTLGRLMRTERVGQTSYLHHEDDVSVRTDVERDLGQRLNDWPAALADARHLANLRGIPFVVVDDVLESAQSKLDAFWAIVQGVASGEMVYPDHLLTGRLKDLADSTSLPALAGQEVSATTPKTPTAVGPTKQSEGEKPGAGRSKGIPLAEAEVRVREWLLKNAKDNPAAITRDAVAAGTDVSTASVSRTAAWQAFRKKRDAEAKPRVREVPLTRGMLSLMKGDDGRDAEPDELASLIEEQRADMAEETRYRKFRI